MDTKRIGEAATLRLTMTAVESQIVTTTAYRAGQLSKSFHSYDSDTTGDSYPIPPLKNAKFGLKKDFHVNSRSTNLCSIDSDDALQQDSKMLTARFPKAKQFLGQCRGHRDTTVHRRLPISRTQRKPSCTGNRKRKAALSGHVLYERISLNIFTSVQKEQPHDAIFVILSSVEHSPRHNLHVNFSADCLLAS